LISDNETIAALVALVISEDAGELRSFMADWRETHMRVNHSTLGQAAMELDKLIAQADHVLHAAWGNA